MSSRKDNFANLQLFIKIDKNTVTVFMPVVTLLVPNMSYEAILFISINEFKFKLTKHKARIFFCV